MSLKKFDKIDSFEDVKRWHEDVKNNLSYDDLSPGDLKMVAPTTDTLGKGKTRLVEISGTPTLYYKTISGTLYKLDFTVV